MPTPPEVTQSGRPLRTEYDGLFFLFGEKFRIVDLENKQDRFITEAQLQAHFNSPSWLILKAELMMFGFFEQGQYRVEVWK